VLSEVIKNDAVRSTVQSLENMFSNNIELSNILSRQQILIVVMVWHNSGFPILDLLGVVHKIRSKYLSSAVALHVIAAASISSVQHASASRYTPYTAERARAPLCPLVLCYSYSAHRTLYIYNIAIYRYIYIYARSTYTWYATHRATFGI